MIMAKGKHLKRVAARRQPKNDRREVFVREYLVDLNATAAYKRAGYTSKGKAAENNASRLMGNDRVKAAIREALRARAVRTDVTTAWVVEEMRKNYDRCVEAGELSAANKALELLGRHTGAFPNKHEHGGPNGRAIPITLVEFGRAAVAGGPTT